MISSVWKSELGKRRGKVQFLTFRRISIPDLVFLDSQNAGESQELVEVQVLWLRASPAGGGEEEVDSLDLETSVPSPPSPSLHPAHSSSIWLHEKWRESQSPSPQKPFTNRNSVISISRRSDQISNLISLKSDSVLVFPPTAVSVLVSNSTPDINIF